MNRLTQIIVPLFVGAMGLHCSETPQGVFGASEDAVVAVGADSVFYIPPSDNTTSIQDTTGDADESSDASDADGVNEDSVIGDTVMEEDGLDSTNSDTEVSDGGSDSTTELDGTGDSTDAEDTTDVASPLPCIPGDYCDDENPCTFTDICNEDSVCVGEAKDCDDGNPCTFDSCDPENGSCLTEEAPGSCGVSGVCEAGICVEYCDDGTQAPCPVVFGGDVILSTAEDITLYEEYTVITGHLTLASPELLVALPNLETVSGSIFVSGISMSHGFTFPALKTVGSDFKIQFNEVLTSFDVPSLETVHGSLMVQSIPFLVNLEFPSLVSIGDELLLKNNVNVKSLDLPLLEGPLPSMVITGNESLPQCLVYALKNQVEPDSVDIATGNCIPCNCD